MAGRERTGLRGRIPVGTESGPHRPIVMLTEGKNIRAKRLWVRRIQFPESGSGFAKGVLASGLGRTATGAPGSSRFLCDCDQIHAIPRHSRSL
jgi:hypothetical protein